MATILQEKAALKTFESIGNNIPTTKEKILVESGYSPKTAKGNAKEVFESEGYKESLEELLKENKIDKNSRLKKLAEIFYSTDKRSSIAANQEISKMLGDYAPIKQEISDLKENRQEITTPE